MSRPGMEHALSWILSGTNAISSHQALQAGLVDQTISNNDDNND